MGESHQGLVLREVRSLLDVISRLAPVESVVDDSARGVLPISVCFRDSESFRPLKVALAEFRGNYSWVPMAHLPYVCLVPLVQEGSSPTSPARALAIQDIASLANFMEHRLSLEGVPSLGLVITSTAKHAGDMGPSGPALLVADPRQYLSNGFVPTSARDRTVEYWISDEEGDLMYDKVNGAHGTASQLRELPLLARLCESKYEDLIILPSEVTSLKEECIRMTSTSADLRPPLERIARICDMASGEQLGIVVLGH